MKGADELRELIEKYDGVITTKDAENEGIHRQYLRELMDDGELVRVSYGIYMTKDNWEDGLYFQQLRKKKMIYSHETALYLHNLTDRDPIKYVVTVPSGYNPSKLKKNGLIVHTVKKEFFELGVLLIETNFGNKVKAYNMERTICDILRDRNNQDPAILGEAIKQYFKRKDKNLNLLMEYAKTLRVDTILEPYLNVML